jgi:hypothetical protein
VWPSLFAYQYVAALRRDPARVSTRASEQIVSTLDAEDLVERFPNAS